MSRMKSRRRIETATGKKVCKRCGQEKALDDFPVTASRNARYGSKTWSYPRPECAACYREYKGSYYAENLERASWLRSITRARKAGVTQFLSFDEWKVLRNDRACHWCGMGLHPSFRHIDHVTPLSRGGQHSADNLVASCANCNMRRMWEQRTEHKYEFHER